MRNLFTGLMAILAITFGLPAHPQITVTDLMDREVTIYRPAERVLLGFNFEDYMAIVGPGAMDKVIGVSLTPWRDWRPMQYKTYLKAMPSIANLLDVGDTESGTFSVEKVIAAKPDLAILAAWQYKALGEGAQQIENAGIPLVVIDYNAQTLEKHVRSTLLIGKVMGADDRAKKLANFYTSVIEGTKARVAKEGASSKKVYVELAQAGPGKVGNSYGNGMWGGVIELVSGTNIAKGQVTNWGPLSPEYFMAQKPDVILLAGSEWPSKPEAVLVGFGADATLANQRMGAYLGRPGWSDLPAVKNGDVYAIYHGGARTLSDFVFVRYLAKVLYPDAFKDVDPMAELRAYYKTWLPIEADGVFVLRHGA